MKKTIKQKKLKDYDLNTVSKRNKEQNLSEEEKKALVERVADEVMDEYTEALQRIADY